jgi:hypothetical protein
MSATLLLLFLMFASGYAVTQDLADKQWLSGEVSAGTYLRPKS